MAPLPRSIEQNVRGIKRARGQKIKEHANNITTEYKTDKAEFAFLSFVSSAEIA